MFPLGTVHTSGRSVAWGCISKISWDSLQSQVSLSECLNCCSDEEKKQTVFMAYHFAVHFRSVYAHVHIWCLFSFLIADGRMVLFSLGNAVCALSDRKYILYRKQIC